MPLPPSTHSTSFSLIIFSSSLGCLSLVNKSSQTLVARSYFGTLSVIHS